MRAIIINSEKQAVTEADIDGKLHDLQGAVGGHIEAVYPGLEGTNHHCYVNDEGLLNNPQHFFMLAGGHQPLAGNGVILSDDDEGNEAPASLPLEWVEDRVLFMDRQAVLAWAANEPGQEVFGSFIEATAEAAAGSFERETGDEPKVTTYVLRLGTPKMLDALEKAAESEPVGEAETAKQTPANIDPWIQGASGNLNISSADRVTATNLLHEFQRLDWWSDYSDDGDVRQREATRTHNAFAQLGEFAGASNDHAYLASRIYDKTAPEEFMKPRTWYVPEHDARQETGVSRWSDGAAQKTDQGQKP